MTCLIDTGVLLRLFNRADPNCEWIRRALWQERRKGHEFAVAIQNMAEFWNVSTRPASSRGGYGLSVFETERRIRLIERFCSIWPEGPGSYQIWRNLLTDHSVVGVQVHDARLVAWMLSHALTTIITLNAADFRRYSRISAITPQEVLNAQPKS